MLDTSTLTSTSATARVRPVVIAAGVAAALNATVAVTQIVAPAQPAEGAFVRLSDYLIEYQFAGSLLATAIAVTLLAAWHRGTPRWGKLGAISAGGYAFATALFGVSAVATAVRGAESLDVIQFPAILLWLLSGLLLAVATVRARRLPVVLGVAFAAGLPASMALGPAGPLALAALWAGVTITLVRHDRGLAAA
jgi:hypothetical protein